MSDEQVAAVTADERNIVCLASPGSGKTTVLVERIKRLLKSTSPLTMVAITFTNAAARQLEERIGQKLGYTGTLHGFMAMLLRKYGMRIGVAPDFGIVTPEQAEDMLKQVCQHSKYRGKLEAIRDQVKAGPFYPDEKLIWSKIETVAKAYHDHLKKHGLLDYDSILHYGLKLVERIPSIDLGYKHLFVDEYQDSGTIDEAIYDALPSGNKFFVGDANQSVYSFRGGTVQNIINRAINPEVMLYELTGNYRCSDAVCRHANILIRKNENIGKDMVGMSHSMGDVACFSHPSDQKEMNWLVASLGAMTPEQQMDTAVLLRTNALVNHFANILTEVGVPVRKAHLPDLPADWSKAVGLVNAYLRMHNNGLVDYWVSKHTPLDLSATRIKSLREGCPISEILGWNTKSIQEVMNFYGVSNDAQSLIFELQQPSNDAWVSALFDVNNEAKCEIGHGVIVTTYHSAKGREWDFVFLPALEQGTVPHKRAEIDEERRLAYMAMTRARISCYVSHAAKRMCRFTRQMINKEPSQFIKESGL